PPWRRRSADIDGTHRRRHADSAPALDVGCIWSAARAIGLCGDWLNGGKVEGAWRSGRQLARAVIDSTNDRWPRP
ncbi:MAG: hypothetical protein KDI53_09350, partial [Candidatus Accumulibacter sp.]|nr:hypothetical protein [Accumulibacter sp.]